MEDPKGRVAGATGLEPAASGVTGRRSNQLSYTPLGFSGGGSIYCARSRKSSKRAFVIAAGMPPIRLISYPDGLNIPLIDAPKPAPGGCWAPVGKTGRR